jgi:MFS family permease
MGSVSKGVKILSLAFLFIFFGYNGVQQYLTIYFSEAGLFKVGFYSLILIYLFFILANPLAALFVSRYGTKKCFLFSSLFYSIFILSLQTKSIVLIYLASIFLGTAASFLWISQNSHLIRTTNEKVYGENSGFFFTFQSLGSALGIFILGFFIAKISYPISFLIFATFPLIGTLLFFKLKNVKPKEYFNRWQLIKKVFFSPTALRFSFLWLGGTFVFGLVLGIIPLQIKETLGISFVGVLTALFFILPITLSYFLGKLSDIKGRNLMVFLSYFIRLIGLFLMMIPQAFFLISGVVLLALSATIMGSISTALVGDVTDKKNLEFSNALFNMIPLAGLVLALLISSQFSIKSTYLISIAATIISFLIIFPLLKLNPKEIKEKITRELNPV